MHPLVDFYYKGRAELKPLTGEYFDSIKKPKKACFIGAIYYGIHKKTLEEDVPFAIAAEYPQIRGWYSLPAPCGHDDEGGLISAILVHLNDEHTRHEWPEKKIAEWLEQALSR